MSEQVLTFLKQRRSTPIAGLGEPAPSQQDIDTILSIASRVPDHGRLAPWRFILYRGDARIKAGKLLAERAEEREGPLSESRREQELNRFARAPLVIGVVCSPRETERIPEWEQLLSAGAAAMQLCNAANALGYGSNWITNWYSGDEEGRRLLGLAPHERVAGFVHIGSNDKAVPERERPDLASVVSEYHGAYTE